MVTDLEEFCAAPEFDDCVAYIRVTERGKIDLLGAGTLHDFPVPADRDIVILTGHIQVEFVIGKGGRDIPPLGAGNTVYKTDGFQGLHLVADGPRVTLDPVGNLLTFDGVRMLVVKGDQRDEDISLDKGQVHNDKRYDRP
jgi:hypothetical protein